MKFKTLLNKLFCKHPTVNKIGWQEQYDPHANIRYSERTYKCLKCGKIFTVDGRYDTYE